ncbi:MAG: hypothetical protein ACYDHN_17210, partial [Solirubrobacteraceae bacterium]
MSNASAATAGPHLTIHSFAAPTHFAPQDEAQCLEYLETTTVPPCDSFHIRVLNAGSLASEGPTVLTDALPPGLVVRSLQLFANGLSQVGECNAEAVPLRCEIAAGMEPDESLEMVVNTTVEEGTESGGVNTASVTAGSGPEVSTSEADVIESTPPPFGPNLTSAIAGLDGEPDTQAGDHPYEMTQTLVFNSDLRVGPIAAPPKEVSTSVQDVKDVVVDLPLGFLGSAVSTPQCTFAQLVTEASCPRSTLVGHIVSLPESNASANSGIFNMVPEYGVPAEFGFFDNLHNSHAIYARVVPTSEGYVLRATSPDLAQINLVKADIVLYGNPAAKNGSGNTPAALFTNPSACTGKPLVMHVYADSWQAPGPLSSDGSPILADSRWASAKSESPPVSGCNRLSFTPESFSLQPESSEPDAATGLNFELRIPQSEAPGTLATPPLKNATVTLPQGLIVNPSAASGLASCSTAQIGWLGGSLSNFTAAEPACPNASKIGSVSLTSPLLAGTLTGSMYLAAQNENPFHSLLGGYIVVDDPQTGVVVKIAGKLTLNAQTGQITGVFQENPQLPFSDLKLHFFGGKARGELATPESCGTFTTSGELEPWSAPESGPPANVSNSFSINGCTSTFAPAFTAGSTSPQAGAYAPFVLSLSRQDGEQEISGLSLSLPPGLEGKIAGVEKCSETAIAAAASNPSGAAEQSNPSCPAGSKIGSVQASAGAGTQPFTLPGSAYLTGPYKGAPYGIAVVVPAIAGPLDLGTVVVRSSLQVDLYDAHVTVTSDPFPTIVDRQGADGQTDGLPIRLRSISVTVDRPGFTLNPTNCTPTAINASVTSTAGTVLPVSSRFQTGGCRELSFHPGFSVSTQAHASKAAGASLHVKVTSGVGQANIGKVHVTLPKQLPSRLTTLQKACLAATFAANPAACPAASLVGTATASTPLLSSPLTGPAYIVSHGGGAFPDLEIVLQGEGITLI